jgi:hypothetical protein
MVKRSLVSSQFEHYGNARQPGLRRSLGAIIGLKRLLAVLAWLRGVAKQVLRAT